MPRLIQRLSESIETNAAAVLAAAGVLSFWLYQRFLVQPANLLLLAQKKQLTLFSIVKGDFSASVGLFTVFLALKLVDGAPGHGPQRLAAGTRLVGSFWRQPVVYVPLRRHRYL